MLKLRYIIRFIEAFFKRFKAIILLGIVFGILSFILITLVLPNLVSENEKIGMVGRFTPNNLPLEISSQISSGLTKIENDSNVSPSLAQSWETPDGGKTWNFILNDSVTWQDKTKITSNDIKYEFSDAAIERPNENIITFKLDSKFSAFPVIVSKPVFKKGLLGTGDWEVKNIYLTGGYVQKLILSNKDNVRKTYKFYPSEDRLKLAFKLGEIDIIKGIQDKTDFDSWKIVSVDEGIGYDNFVGIFFNTEDEKLSEKTIRQALNYAIDKESLGGHRALSPISPYSWAYNPQVKPYLKDLEKVKEVSGLNIKLATLPNLLQVAEKIAAEWRNAGANVEIETASGIPENFQAFLATVDIPKDPDQYTLWHSTQTATNISRFKNARIDKLLEDGRTELDQESRKKIYLDFQRFLVEDVPAIFLYHPTFYTITRK